MTVTLGCDRLLMSDRLCGERVGLVCNPASVDGCFRPTAARIADHSGARLTALFGPQHGSRADVQDNMIETGHTFDRAREVPVYSLYSETREPTAEMLKEVDLLVVDLPDVGTRVYTFIYTMANCLRAAHTHGLPVIVCDRPNPIGGVLVEGPVLRREFASFVGQYPIPLRHGMTIGELARLFNEHFGIGARLEVFTLEGWRREDYFDETGLPWVMPSPNMPTLDTAIVFPGCVLFEGTNVSEGRGTTRPFELVGAPWVDADRFTGSLNAEQIPGVHFRAVGFEPTFHKYAGQYCGGCQIHVIDRTTFRPVMTAVTLLRAFRQAGPDRFAWREPPYEYEHVKLPIDVLTGSDELRTQIESDVSPIAIARSWEPAVAEFQAIRQRFLLY